MTVYFYVLLKSSISLERSWSQQKTFGQASTEGKLTRQHIPKCAPSNSLDIADPVQSDDYSQSRLFLKLELSTLLPSLTMHRNGPQYIPARTGQRHLAAWNGFWRLQKSRLFICAKQSTTTGMPNIWKIISWHLVTIGQLFPTICVHIVGKKLDDASFNL